MALDIRIRFGRAIRRIREAQKINQEEAAERCGLHRTYYSGVERGIRNVSLVNIDKIARGLKKASPNCSAGSNNHENKLALNRSRVLDASESPS
jgi:transcriptional regulator with XRE-family HTH domain